MITSTEAEMRRSVGKGMILFQKTMEDWKWMGIEEDWTIFLPLHRHFLITAVIRISKHNSQRYPAMSQATGRTGYSKLIW